MADKSVLSIVTAMCWYDEKNRFELLEDLKSDPELRKYQDVIENMDLSGFEPDSLPFTRKDSFLYDHWSKQSIGLIQEHARDSRVITSVPEFSIFPDESNIVFLSDEKYYLAFHELYGESLSELAAGILGNGDEESLWMFTASSLPMFYCMKKAVKNLQKVHGLSLYRKGSMGSDGAKEMLTEFITAMDLFPVVNILTTQSIVDRFEDLFCFIERSHCNVNFIKVCTRTTFRKAAKMAVVDEIAAFYERMQV